MLDPDRSATSASRDEQVRAATGREHYAGTGIAGVLIAALIAAAAALVFIAQNGESVAVQWLWVDFRVSLAVIILSSALLTVAVDEALGLAWRSRRRRRLRDTEELHRLRSETPRADAPEALDTQE